MTPVLAATESNSSDSDCQTVTAGCRVATPTPQVPAAKAVYTWADKDNWHDIPTSGSFWIVVEDYWTADPTIYEVAPCLDGYTCVTDLDAHLDGEATWRPEDVLGWALDRKTASNIAAFVNAGAA